MVKNKFGGNRAKTVARKSAGNSKKDLILRQTSEKEEYAKVHKMLGDRRIMAILPDKREVMAHIPGRIKKRLFPGDIVLVVAQIDGVESGKYSIIHAYDIEDVRDLIKAGELEKSFAKTENIYINNDSDYDFDGEDDCFNQKNSNKLEAPEEKEDIDFDNI
jgi:initiation factor 1A